MKAYIITTGHFSKAGNFIGYSAKGEKIHIYKKQIFEEFPDVEIIYNCIEQYDPTLITFPFYCLADAKTFDHVNIDGTKTGEKFTRLTAVEISESTLGIVEHAVSDVATDRISQELTRAKKNYNRLENKYAELYKAYKARELEMQAMQWNYEYAQTERERLQQHNDDLKAQIESGGWDDQFNRVQVEKLEKKCQKHEDTIMNLQAADMTSKHVISKIEKIANDYFNKLIV